ncbi:hypothetical protein QJS04_geneDACA023936 [Acorus gramineus]|uniref:Uncharacterized protein n=1 Tax=Acorus gramineus TaxID=55184 RepID=A0AAV8ZYW3_ACOGR|nr:hypothetical protein QJS04_geneDACA023936 [Acorus gramineus]
MREQRKLIADAALDSLTFGLPIRRNGELRVCLFSIHDLEEQISLFVVCFNPFFCIIVLE